MINEIIKPLTITNADIKDNMKGIIEAFVEFYGENNRESIETKFNNVLILRKYSSDSLDKMINDMYNELYRIMFKIDSKYILNYDFNKIYKAINKKNIYDSELKYFIGTSLTTSDFLELYYKGKYDKLSIFFRMFKKTKDLLRPYEEELKSNRKEEKIIRRKFYEQLVTKYKRILPTRLLDSFDIKTLDTIDDECSEFIHLFFGYDSINFDNCFSPKCELLLHDSSVSNGVKNGIKNDRVRILELYGAKHKSSYEEYLEDIHYVKIINSLIELSNEIEKVKTNLSLIQAEEIFKSQKNYKENIRIIQNKGYLSTKLDHNMYNDNSSQLIINYIYDGNRLVFSPIIIFDIYSKNNDRDCTIIHELNHLYECNVTFKNGKIKCVSGWDKVLGNAKLNKDNKRKYELVNEYINDEIAKEIASILRKNKDYIYSDKQENLYSTVYNFLDFLLSDFYNEFKDVIIESRKEGNMNILYNRVGKTNFELLNDLVTSFNLMYGLSIESYMLVQYSINNPNAEESKNIIELINMKNIIIENMKNHSMKKVKRNNRLK